MTSSAIVRNHYFQYISAHEPPNKLKMVPRPMFWGSKNTMEVFKAKPTNCISPNMQMSCCRYGKFSFYHLFLPIFTEQAENIYAYSHYWFLAYPVVAIWDLSSCRQPSGTSQNELDRRRFRLAYIHTICLSPPIEMVPAKNLDHLMKTAMKAMRTTKIVPLTQTC